MTDRNDAAAQPAPGQLVDLQIEVMLDLEFVRSNPSPEVARSYARDHLLAYARRHLPGGGAG